MILQSLKEYYDRKAIDPDSGIAPEGFQFKEIPFVIVLDREGKLVQIECTRISIGKKLRAKSRLVPQEQKRTRGIKANLLWDNAEYLLGLSSEKNSEVVQKHLAFIEKVKHLNLESDEGVYSVVKFLHNDPIAALEGNEYLAEIKETNPFMTFRFVEDNCWISERFAVINKVQNASSTNLNSGTCMITGETDFLSKLQPAIKGVRDANSTGGNIVSFNLDAFNSYGKKQGANAPIGEKASFAYTTALNHLLSKDSKQKIQVGDATVIFWSEKESFLENNFCAMFDEPPKDDPDQNIELVRALYRAVESGTMPAEEKESRFFVLGLSPNAARISIRFWQVGTVSEFSTRIRQHFCDLNIEHAPYEKEQLSLWRLLLSTAVQGKTENILPNISGEWMRAILAGLPYPDSLYQAVLRRIHAEKNVSYSRAAIIKAYLNRRARFQHQTEEHTVSLDKGNQNPGYRLGRLFAVLEKLQEEASNNRDINSTIRDRYYSSASATPNSVFPILLRLQQHHLRKLNSFNKGRSINLEKLITEIVEDISDFPSRFNLMDQGRFALGYYHQRQDFFKKSDLINANQGE